MKTAEAEDGSDSASVRAGDAVLYFLRGTKNDLVNLKQLSERAHKIRNKRDYAFGPRIFGLD